MQANPTERLQQALARARGMVGRPNNEVARTALRQELDGIAQAVEGVMAIWDQMEKANVDLQSVDANFYSAGEIYLDACEKITDALNKNSLALLNDVEHMLQRAGRQLVSANDRAQAELQRLAQTGEQATP